MEERGLKNPQHLNKVIPIKTKGRYLEKLKIKIKQLTGIKIEIQSRTL